MDSVINFRGIKYMLIGVMFLNPFTIPTTYAASEPAAIYGLAEEPIIAELRLSSKEGGSVHDKADKPSDFWKYVVSGLVMFFFLSIAIFVQIRAERDK